MTRKWTPRRGDVVLLRFPFIDSATGAVTTKMRPALVVSGSAIHRHTSDIIVLAISSRPASRPLPTDFEIRQHTPEFQRSGLRVTSWIKASNITFVPRSAVHRRVGHLPAQVLQLVEERLRLALEL